MNAECVLQFTWLPFPISVVQDGDENVIVDDIVPVAIDEKGAVPENGFFFFLQFQFFFIKHWVKWGVCKINVENVLLFT